jgi:hypothetical protein
MQLPEMLEGPSLTRLIQGALFGAAATAFIGFNWGGWALESTARQRAVADTSAAMVAVLAPMCADKFRSGSEAAVNTKRRLGNIPRHVSARSRHRPGMREAARADAVTRRAQ